MQRNHRWIASALAMAAGYVTAAMTEAYVAQLLFALPFAVCAFLPKRLARNGALLVLIALASTLYYDYYDAKHQSQLLIYAQKEERLSISGTVDSIVRRDGDSVRFFLLADNIGFVQQKPRSLQKPERVAVRIRLTAEEQIKQVELWRQGDRIESMFTLKLPDPARNPYAFDYANYLRNQGVTVICESSYSDLFAYQQEKRLPGLFQMWQKQAAERVAEAFPNPVTAGYLQSLLFGVTDGPDPELQGLYRDLGLIHVLAISGLHVTLVSMFCMTVLKWCRFGEKPAFFLTSVFLCFYVLLVGASPSAIRAGLMGGLYLWGRMLKQQWQAHDLLGCSFVVMLLFEPYQLWQVGFQLSFLVTWGLLIYVPLFMSVAFPRQEWLRSLIAVTTAAQLVSFPIIIFWFHQLSPLSWIVNLLIVPVLSFVVLPLGYAVIVLGYIHPALNMIPATVTDKLLNYLHAMLTTVGDWRVPFTFWPHPDWWWLFCYGLIVMVIPIFWYRGYHRKRDMIGYWIAMLFLAVLARQPFSLTEEVRITFLDVGQGDCAVVEIHNQLAYIIDSGGTPLFHKEKWRERRDPFEVGKDTVLPFLKARGIETIDRMVLTHGDYDHIGGFSSILPHVSVSRVLVNGKQPQETEAGILMFLQAKKVPIVTGQPGQSWMDTPEVRWTWLNPGQRDDDEDNDASVVLLLEAYGKRVLFTGDMGFQVEKQLLSQGLLPPVDVLKVAHHGSKTGTTEDFLQQLRPELAVISVGRNNRYGHPAQEVIKRLETYGSTIIRTDQSGAVTVTITRTGLKWSTQLNDNKKSF